MDIGRVTETRWGWLAFGDTFIPLSRVISALAVGRSIERIPGFFSVPKGTRPIDLDDVRACLAFLVLVMDYKDFRHMARLLYARAKLEGDETLDFFENDAPIIHNTGIPVRAVFENLAEGKTVGEALTALPPLTTDDLLDCFSYGTSLLKVYEYAQQRSKPYTPSTSFPLQDVEADIERMEREGLQLPNVLRDLGIREQIERNRLIRELHYDSKMPFDSYDEHPESRIQRGEW